MPIFSKFKNRILKRDSDVPSAPAPVPANKDPSPALPNVTATSTADDLSDEGNELWARAYTLAKEREKQLIEDYERHITSLEGVSVDGKSFSAPHDVKAHVNQLLEIRQRKEIQVSIMGHDITMREQIEKLAKFLLWSDAIVKSAVSAQPYAALAWSGVSLFLPLLVCGAKYNEGMLDGFGSISDMQMFWKSYEETYIRQPDMKSYQTLKDLLAKLYSFIIEYQARVICHLSNAQLSRAWNSMMGPDDWDNVIKPAKELHDMCLCLVDRVHKDVIQTKMDSQLQEIQKSRIVQEEMLQVIKEDREDEKERKLLSDLAATSGDYERYKNINPERVPGTCMWFLTDERFLTWRDKKSGDLLWVSAGPGCGKSVLSKSLIEERHLSPDTTVTITSSTITVSQSIICYFFFKDGGEGKMDSAQALCAILHQLFIHTPQLMAHALASHKKHSQDLMRRTDELWRIFLDCVDSSPVPIICLLDALDECEEESRTSLTKKLCDLYLNTNSSAPPRLRFLITSRPYETFKMSFDRLTTSPAYLHFDGDDKSGQIGQETNLVIDVRVDYITSSFTTEDRNKISQRLKDMESRTYLWLHLTLEIIERNMSAYSRRLDMEEFLSKLPSTVSDAYEKILSRSQDDKKVEALLQIVLAAERPLTLDEANYALTLALGDDFSSHEKLQENLWPQDRFKTTPGNLCGLFISIHDSKLYLIHQTAREFLLDTNPSGAWRGRLNLSRSHGTLAKACMSYLLMLDAQFENTTKLKEKYPFSSYAASSWFLHFQSQDAGSTDTSRKLARSLCDISAPQTRNWLEGCDSYTFSDIHALLQRSIDLWLAVVFNLPSVVSDMMTHEHPDVNANDVLHPAISKRNYKMIEILLSPNSGVRIGKYHISRAARKTPKIFALLLDKWNGEVKIDERTLMGALSNYHNGAAILDLIFTKCPNEVSITKELLEYTIRNGSAETLLLLLNKRGSQEEITEDVVLATVRVRSGTEMISALLEHYGHKITFTESLMIAAMQRTSFQWLDIVLAKRGNDIKITEGIFETIVGRKFYATGLTILLLREHGHEFKITRGMLETASAIGSVSDDVMALLEDRYHRQMGVPGDSDTFA
ncbi:NACHT_N domain-containing protein [Trichoderma simmonsii]|uniref:NACHT_N domain-containing protein n=1 Tax=Trichoderma simmonsii TaxID=1491479 RepID=A0A8G0PHY8_9HYPO|nr:NACHT_N domain-containing protein [Trichoderma simmonsii]